VEQELSESKGHDGSGRGRPAGRGMIMRRGHLLPSAAWRTHSVWAALNSTQRGGELSFSSSGATRFSIKPAGRRTTPTTRHADRSSRWWCVEQTASRLEFLADSSAPSLTGQGEEVGTRLVVECCLLNYVHCCDACLGQLRLWRYDF
jgi:hypothetical protein